MFFKKTLKHRVLLMPHQFGPDINNSIIRSLYMDIEGTCHGNLGLIICVLNILDKTQDVIRDSMGYAVFYVTYEALILMPFKGEVVDAKVQSIVTTGLFANLGPLKIFVSNHLIPDQFQFDNSNDSPTFVDIAKGQKITIGDLIRLRIIGLRVETSLIHAVGTIREDSLGLVYNH